ncbi:MAG: primosomal protein N' [Candidatus Moranbacteria bacterium]|nr:primosomal protein N' [Candidatus Moranbacteria bacterium]
MATETLYRLEVAPLTILSLGKSPFFTYASTAPVPKGSLVSVSFGKQTLEGIVFECDLLPGTKPVWMKYISSVLRESFLTKEQCALADAISREYFTPLGKVLRHFLPKVVKSRTSLEMSTQKLLPAPRPTKAEKSYLEKIAHADKPASIDTSYLTDPKKLWVLMAQQSKKEKRQLLILVPEITLVFPLEGRLRPYFGDTVTTLHSKLSPGAFFTAWERIRTGQAQIIIATRQGLFAPFLSLGTIIVTEEQDESYKQWDMSPRYHGKRVANMLASFHSAKLLFASATPSTDSLLKREHGALVSVSPIMTHPALKNALTIVNLKLERYRKNFSPLSEALVQAIRDTLGRGEQVLLYINRQGMNAFSVCEGCKNTFRCKKCEHPLGSTRDGSFRCVACGYTTALFPSCPSCGHLSFRHIGFGTEKVEKEVQKLFPQARTVRLDSSTLKTASVLENILEQNPKKQIDVLIGTQMILKDPPLPKLALIAMIDADSLLLFPDFRADERLFQDLSRAVRQVAPGPNRTRAGIVLLQTFHPESAFLQKISTFTSTEFLSAILADRKDLFYPPYSRLITISCQGKTEKEVKEKEARITAKLQKSLPPDCRLRSAQSIRFHKKQYRFESDILLRIPALHEAMTKELATLLIHIGEDSIIDVDPTSQK